MLLIFSMALAVGGLHSHHCVAVIMAGSYLTASVKYLLRGNRAVAAI